MTPTAPTETQSEEPTPAQTSEPEEEPDALPPPALQSKPAAFDAQMDKVLGALDARGYETTTGEIGSANSESRVLAPIAPNSDLPVVLLLLEWGTSEPFGDGTTTGSRELPDFTLREIGDGEVWFFCGEMIVRLRADLSKQEFDALAGGLYNESC